MALEQLSTGDGGWSEAHAWAALKELSKQHPRVELSAISTANAVHGEVPEEISKLFAEPTLSQIFLEQTAPEHVSTVAAAWQQARLRGAAHCRAVLLREPDTERSLYWLDFREAFGIVLLIVLPSDDAMALATVPPVAFVVRDRIMVHLADETSQLLAIDDATTETLGWGDEVLGQTTLSFIHPEDHERSIAMWVELLADPGGARQVRLRYRHVDGHYLWVETTNVNLLLTEGHIRREVVDVTEEVRAVGDARNRELVLASLAEALPSGIAQFDQMLQQVFSNRQWDQMLAERRDVDLAEFAADVGLVPTARDATDALRGGTTLRKEITLESRDDGSERRYRLHIEPVTESDGTFEGAVCCLDDITESWNLQRRLSAQATSDALTGLANRSGIVATLDAVLAEARAQQMTTAVLFLDFDGFKRVNDQFGHAAGDTLLGEIAETFRLCLRPDDTIGRQGGDEFIVVCRDVGGVAGATAVAQRLLRAASGSWSIRGQRVETRASCGITLDVNGRSTSEALIAEADLAMYEHKRDRGAGPVVFRRSMFDEQRLELRRDTALATATTDGSLEVHYQPIVTLNTQSLVGFEALARWRFDDAPVGPDVFIPAAERRAFIDDIGEFVLREVCAASALDPTLDLVWSVNVSPVQLANTDFPATVSDALDGSGLAPARLALEITEGMPIVQSAKTRKVLFDLHDLGVRIMVDDFGTGFASLDYLRDLPMSAVKIDRSFVDDLDNPRTAAIVETVVSMADRLDLYVVTEGVETDEQRQALMAMGARMGQGYLFGRPEALTAHTLHRYRPSGRSRSAH